MEPRLKARNSGQTTPSQSPSPRCSKFIIIYSYEPIATECGLQYFVASGYWICIRLTSPKSCSYSGLHL